MPIRIAQSSEPTGPGHWRWSVWLDGSTTELDGVEYVVYTLHPTFSQPVRRTSDRAAAFRLDSSGWGEFEIHAAVHHRDGRGEEISHWLVLGTGAESRGPMRGEEDTRIYLSYGLTDAAAANAIRQALGDEPGVQVTTSEELSDAAAPGVSFDRLIHDQLRSVSRAVFLVSGNPSPWIRREVEMAESLGVPHAYVTVGDTHPPLMDDSPRVASMQVKGLEPDNASDVAHAIARWTREG